jgi:hypothetical protein
MKKAFSIISAAVVFAFVASMLILSGTDSLARTSSKSICMNKQSNLLSVRADCRKSERNLGPATALTEGAKSAYDIWLELGNKGTKQQFLNSLIGASGSSGSSSPFNGYNCTGAVYHSYNLSRGAYILKSSWDYVESQTGCDIDSTPVSYDILNPVLNSSVSNFNVDVIGSATLVRSTRSSNGYYEVPVNVDFDVNLSGGWVVCDSTLSVYGNTSWSSTETFTKWAYLESEKVSPGKYSVDLTATVDRSELWLGSSESMFQIPFCIADSTNSRGWRMVQISAYPFISPREFTGLGIPYISLWGWE